MKVAVVVLLSAFVAVATANQNLGVCGGSCSSSAACANQAGDLLCRCVNFVCSMTEPCGGSCLTDTQCKDWAGGDDKCVCSWTQCKLESQILAHAKNPRRLFLDTIAAKKPSNE